MSKSASRLLPCQFSRPGFQYICCCSLIITAIDNFPNREESFLLRFYIPSAGLLGTVFVFLPQSCCTICLLLITEGQNNYKGQEKERFFISFPSPKIRIQYCSRVVD